MLRARACWIVSLLLATWGCAVAPSRAEVPVSSNEVAAELAARFPSDALALVLIRDPWSTLDALGREQLVAALREPYEKLVWEVVRATERDLLSAAGWSDIGVDPAGTFGVAVLPAASEVLAVALPVADPARFKQALYRFVRDGGQPRVVADAVVVDGGAFMVVLRAKTATVVMGGHVREVAERLAKLHPGDSLGDDEAFTAAMRRADTGAPVRGYIDIRAVAYMQLGMDSRWRGRTTASAMKHLERAHRRALARAREDRARIDELVAIDDDFSHARTRLEGEDAPESRSFREWLGAIQGASLALVPEQDGAKLSIDVMVEEGSLLDRLVRPAGRTLDGPPPIVKSLAAAPLGLVHLDIDPSAMVEMAKALGSPPDALSKGLGLDVNRELVPALTGELGVAVRGGGSMAEALWDPKRLRALSLLGMRDAGRAKTVLDRLAASELLGSWFKKGEGAKAEGMLEKNVVDIPGLGAMRFAIAAGALALSNDARWLKAPASGSRAWTGKSPALRLLALPANALVQYQVGFALLQALAHKPPEIRLEPPMREPEVPVSPEYEKKLGQLSALEKRMNEATMARETARLAGLEPDARALGHVTVRVRRREGAIRLEARYAAEGALGDAVAAAMLLFKDQPLEPDDALPTKLDDEKRRVEEELEAIYAREVDEFLRKREEPTPAP